jgi:hypothetical protein
LLTVNIRDVSLDVKIAGKSTYPSPPAGISAPSNKSLSNASETLSLAFEFSGEALSPSSVVFPLPSLDAVDAGEAFDAGEAVCLSSSLFLRAAALSTAERSASFPPPSL